MANPNYPTLPAPWIRHGKGWRWNGATSGAVGDVTIQPTRQGWVARNGGFQGIRPAYAFDGEEGLQEFSRPGYFATHTAAAAAAQRLWNLPRPRLQNDGARAVAREYAKRLGIPKSEMRKLTGKKFTKMQKSPRRALTPQQERSLLVRIKEFPADVQLGIMLALTLGLRVAEIATIRPDASGVNVVGKGNKPRHVPFSIDSRSRAAVRQLASVTPASPGRLQAALRKLQDHIPGITPHVLRHTYATRAMQRAVDPKKLQGALGHRSFKTTLTYLSTIQS